MSPFSQQGGNVHPTQTWLQRAWGNAYLLMVLTTLMWGCNAVASRLAELGFEVTPGNAAALAAHGERELARWRTLVAEANITIE